MFKKIRVKKLYIVIFLIQLFLYNICCYASDFSDEIKFIAEDYRNFYLDKRNLLNLTVGFIAAGIVANSAVDTEVQKYYQKKIRGKTSDEISSTSKLPGHFYLSVPLLSITYLLSDNEDIKQWSERSLRAIIVGAPAGLFLQRVTGSSRPEEGDSKWRPFRDNNGLSGHAFIGSVPFITAAMSSEDKNVKVFFYTLSLLPGLTRINDNEHYLSQVGLGWFLGYLSCKTVHKNSPDSATVFLIPQGKGGAVVINYTF